jgi:hypothetical protein
MSVPIQLMSELTDRAKQALVQELGVVDTMRFLSQFRAGSGDYTSEREALFRAESVASILTGIKAQREKKAQDPS